VEARLGLRISLLVLAVGLLAVFLRLWALDLGAFTYDDADVVLRARDLLAGNLSSRGAMTSWGFPDPPLLVYLQVLTAMLPDAAFASLALMAVVNTLAVLQTTLLGIRFFNARVGLIAGLLFAVNPWAIYFGRRAWVEAQPLLTVLCLWAALEVFRGARTWAVGFFLALALHVQARLTVLADAPAVLATLLIGGRRWPLRWSLVGVLLGALVTAPYAWWIYTHWSEVYAAWAAGNRGVVGAPRGNAFEFVIWSLAGYNLLPTPSGLAPWLDALNIALLVATTIGCAALVGGVAVCLARAVRHQRGWRDALLLVAWLVLPLGLIAWQSSTVYLHYLPLLFPIPSLISAIGIDHFIRRGRAFAMAGAVSLALLIVPQLVTWGALLQALQIYNTDERVETSVADRRMLAELIRQSAQRIGTGEQYGVETPVRFWLATEAAVESAARDVETRDVLVMSTGTDPLSEEQPAILESFLGAELTLHYPLLDSRLLESGRPTVGLQAPFVEPPVQLHRLGARQAVIPLPTTARTTRDGSRVYTLPGRSETEWAAAMGLKDGPWLVPPYRLAGLNYSPRVKAGDQIEVTALWVVTEQASAPRPALALVGPDDRVWPQREPAKLASPPVGLGLLLVEQHVIALGRNAADGDYRLVAGPGVRRGEQRAVDGVGVDVGRISVGGR
jgi:4-amino-4-deoxy-L-arabinose transferase-like glycosyltransferase